MDMQHGHGHGHAAWTRSCSTALVMQHVSGQWTCMDAGMPECDKEFSPASLFFPLFTTLSLALAFRHRGQSGTAGHGPVH